MVRRIIIMNQKNLSLQLILHKLVLLLVCTRAAFGEAESKCIERERQALLIFKQGLKDERGSLSSWRSEDCCQWKGVHCSKRTGHVVALDLHSYGLGGNITSPLLVLQQLNYLDLSDNDFGGNKIPEFIGSLTKLRFLDLASSNFTGKVPSQLGNLTSLQSLSIGYNGIHVGKFEWLPHLYKLANLDLEHSDLGEATDWVQVITGLPSLIELDLTDSTLPTVNYYNSLSSLNSSTSLAHLHLLGCNLSNSAYHWLSKISKSLVQLQLNGNHFEGPVPSYAFRNMTSLMDLDLTANQITGILKSSLPISLHTLNLVQNQLRGPVPSFAFRNMTSVVHLDLSYNQITGISKSFGDMCSLKTLNLNMNNLTGQLPSLFSNLSGCARRSLESLNLQYNMLSGPLSDITKFSSLRELDISYNRLDGTFPKIFGQPSSLVTLWLYGNQLWGSLPDLSVFPLLRSLDLRGHKLNGTISEGIGQLPHLEELNLQFNSLQGIITEAHMSNLSKLKTLDFSYNSLALNFSPNWLPPFQLDFISLTNCKLGPRFPKWLRSQKKYYYLDISNARILDTVPDWFWDDLSPKIDILNLSNNQMKGKIPDLSKFTFYEIDLSSNCFDGPIPPMPSNLVVLFLSKNKFSGSISFLCAITSDHWFLDLSDNQLSGEILDCSSFWQNLRLLNLANNNFSGRIPNSVYPVCQMESLHLRNNSLIGELPSGLKNCTSLKVVDLGSNKISGTIPPWIGDSLEYLVILSLRSNNITGSLPPRLCNLANVQVLDFSQNNIFGTIPKCLTNLSAMVQKESPNAIIQHYVSRTDSTDHYRDDLLLVWKGLDSMYRNTLGLLKSIDLSSNKLCDKIPEEITSLMGLLSLNLSRNRLTGPIPPKIGELVLLNSLDLSQNHLFGKIPESSSQLSHLGVLNLSSNNLSGKIPSNIVLQTFEASAYMGNPELCGAPLPNKCPGEEPATHQVPAIFVHDSEEKDDFINRGFYISIALGFIISFWGFCGTLLLNRNWRHAYFQFLNNLEDNLYVWIAVKMTRLQRWL